MKPYLREMTPGDVPAVLERLREQNERDGSSYSMPLVFDSSGVRLKRIPLALVMVDEDGQVLQGHVWEETVEQMTFGISPRATVSSMHEQEAVFWLLRERGYQDQHILVPRERLKDLGDGLDRILGMIDTGETLAHFYRLLDPVANEELRDWYRKRREERDHEQRPAGADVRHSIGREQELQPERADVV